MDVILKLCCTSVCVLLGSRFEEKASGWHILAQEDSGWKMLSCIQNASPFFCDVNTHIHTNMCI